MQVKMQGSVSLGNVCKKENQAEVLCGGFFGVCGGFAITGNILKMAE